MSNANLSFFSGDNEHQKGDKEYGENNFHLALYKGPFLAISFRPRFKVKRSKVVAKVDFLGTLHLCLLTY